MALSAKKNLMFTLIRLLGSLLGTILCHCQSPVISRLLDVSCFVLFFKLFFNLVYIISSSAVKSGLPFSAHTC